MGNVRCVIKRYRWPHDDKERPGQANFQGYQIRIESTYACSDVVRGVVGPRNAGNQKRMARKAWSAS